MVRKKLIDLCRRAVPVLAAMLLLVAVASPAYASVDRTYYAPIPFEEFCVLTGEANTVSKRFSWPFNVHGSSYPSPGYAAYLEDGNYDEYLYFSSVSNSGPNVDSNYAFTFDAEEFGLCFSNYTGFVLPQRMLADGSKMELSFYAGLAGLVFSGSVTFQVATVIETNGGYDIKWQRFTKYYSNIGSLNLIDAINTMITDSSYKPGAYLYIRDFEARFTFLSDDPYGFALDFTGLTSRPTVTDWYNQFDLNKDVIISPSDPLAGDFYGWLVTSVQGFTQAELWNIGGQSVTIGGILGVCFVVGLLFWFLKIAV